MSVEESPIVPTFDQTVKANDALAAQQKDYDCTPCRLMGSAAFAGLGIYSYASGMSQLREREHEIMRSGSRFGMGARRGAVFVLSAWLVGVGVWRLKY